MKDAPLPLRATRARAGTTRRTRWPSCVLLIVSLVVAGLGLTALGPDRAGACSFAGPHLDVPSSAEAGGELRVGGSSFFRIEGTVDSDCGGDYELVALTDVVVVAIFDTPAGPQEVRTPVAVSGPAENYSLGPISIPIPADATAAAVHAESDRGATGTHDVEILGGTPSPPAPPIRAEARFTG